MTQKAFFNADYAPVPVYEIVLPNQKTVKATYNEGTWKTWTQDGFESNEQICFPLAWRLTGVYLRHDLRPAPEAYHEFLDTLDLEHAFPEEQRYDEDAPF